MISRSTELLGSTGLFYAVPAGESPDNCQVDLYLAASRMAPDAFLGYTSALELWAGFEPKYARRMFVYTESRVRPTWFRGHQLVPCSIPWHLLRRGYGDFGVETLERDLLRLRLTGPERTLVDVLANLNRYGAWQLPLALLQTLTLDLKIDVVVEYLRLLENPTTNVRVGWFLDYQRERLNRDPWDFAIFYDDIPGQPRYLVPCERGGRMISDWNLIVPAKVAKSYFQSRRR